MTSVWAPWTSILIVDKLQTGLRDGAALRVAVHRKGKAQIVGGQRRAILPGEAGLEPPGDGHRATGLDLPAAVLRRGDGVGEPGVVHIGRIEVAEPAVEQGVDLGQSG